MCRHSSSAYGGIHSTANGTNSKTNVAAMNTGTSRIHAARRPTDQSFHITAAALANGPVQKSTANAGTPSAGMMSRRRKAQTTGRRTPHTYTTSGRGFHLGKSCSPNEEKPRLAGLFSQIRMVNDAVAPVARTCSHRSIPAWCPQYRGLRATSARSIRGSQLAGRGSRS